MVAAPLIIAPANPGGQCDERSAQGPVHDAARGARHHGGGPRHPVRPYQCGPQPSRYPSPRPRADGSAAPSLAHAFRRGQNSAHNGKRTNGLANAVVGRSELEGVTETEMLPYWIANDPSTGAPTHLGSSFFLPLL